MATRARRILMSENRLAGIAVIVPPRFRAVVLVHGHFWHAYDCHQAQGAVA
jgi:G:T-mismatch repair DNA endonuclease (very short patch repair protein)